MADNVIIARKHLETLLRRANLHDTDEVIKVPTVLYNSLLQDAQRFYNLKTALMAGGASEETIDVLVNQNAPLNSPQEESSQNHFRSEIVHERSRPIQQREWIGNKSTQQARGLSTYQIEQTQRNHNDRTPEHGSDIGHDYRSFTPTTVTSIDRSDTETVHQPTTAPHVKHDGNRSLVIDHIANNTTILDLTKVIRGGMLSKVSVHRHGDEYSGRVTFVNSKHATEFLLYAQQKHIIIRGWRIKVYWDKKQTELPQYLLNRISAGATRNLVVRSLMPDITAGEIRNDLEHIHGLQIIDITLDGENAWLRLNAIRYAVSAKGCMQSRLKYKSSVISFFADECDKPLPLSYLAQSERLLSPTVSKSSSIALSNRFDALTIDSFNDDSDEEHGSFL